MFKTPFILKEKFSKIKSSNNKESVRKFKREKGENRRECLHWVLGFSVLGKPLKLELYHQAVLAGGGRLRVF